MVRFTVVLALLVAFAQLAIAQDAQSAPTVDATPVAHAEFKSAEARAAMIKYETAVKDAKLALLKELEAAKIAATKAADLDEAIKIRDKIKELTPPAKATAASVKATEVLKNPHELLVGIWQVTIGDSEVQTYTLTADKKATRTGTAESFSHGTWQVDAGGRLVITWSSGTVETYTAAAGSKMTGSNNKGSVVALSRPVVATAP